MSHDLDLKKVLWLSRLKATPDEEIKMKESLVGILDWISVMDEVDTSNVEPLRGSSHSLPRRDDVITDGGYPEKIIRNAPDQAYGMFGVPKVVE